MPRFNNKAVEFLISVDTPQVKVVSQSIEILVARPTASPTVITGAGVSQQLLELLVSPATPNVRVNYQVIELLVASVVGGSIPSEFKRKAWVTID